MTHNMTLAVWYHRKANEVCSKAAERQEKDYIGFKIFDDISGENLTDEVANWNWDEFTVSAVEEREGYIAVYIAI